MPEPSFYIAFVLTVGIIKYIITSITYLYLNMLEIVVVGQLLQRDGGVLALLTMEDRGILVHIRHVVNHHFPARET